MTTKIPHQISRSVGQESEHSESDHTHTPSTQTIEAVNDRLKQAFVDSCEDAYLFDRVDVSHYQEKGKTDWRDYTPVITLIGSFLVMSLVSLVGSNLLPTPRTQNPTSNSSSSITTLDVAPLVTPMQMMGFN
jgi:hypothetical protein